ncbi:SDR family oxidoreductase [Aliiglaciecola sp. LCG003]|uniref:SDR family oxidoreductase n=1 Tax=Aliiglaciecola sp. LCG003 TaxID=3053655 RepID=UPI002573FCDA|nr:SDR family oxidoreductase [Aliiglaciecola sp. LCG003]WJG09191.1 SDR family oxidoreductase [Aliiglaciecola sp. LCG003]
MNWQQQTCLLTGATGGIGEAIAQQLAEKGVRLILQGRNEQKLTQLVNSLPGQHDILVGDINNQNDRNRIVKHIGNWGGLTMLINNAGISEFNQFEHSNTVVLQRLIETNLTAPILLTRMLLPLLKQNMNAHIINIGSTFGSIGFACHSAYCASKFGLRGFTESLQREFKGSSINVLYFAPRATNTAINSDKVVAMNRALSNKTDDPQWVAKQLLKQIEKRQTRMFLGFPEKLFVKINGAFPHLVDSALFKKLPIIKRFAATSSKEAIS